MTSSPEKPKRSVGQRMGIAAAILAVSILLSRVLGFLREAVIAYTHGASYATDAYYAAFTLPDLMNYFLAGGTLSITFIPLFSSFVARGDEEGGWRLFSTVATTMGSGLVLFTILFEILAPYVIPILNPGFDDPEQIALAVAMTRIVIPAQLCFYFGGLIQATLFVRETFWPSAIAPLVYNLCIILGGVLLDPWFGIKGFSIGVVVGAILGPLLIPAWAARKHMKLHFRFAPRDPGFREFIVLTLPLMLGVGLVTVDEWLLRYFGSMHPDGAITWLNNSRKLMLVAFAVIGQAAGQAALPFLTRLFHEDREDEMGQMLALSLRRVLFLSALATAALVVVADPLVYVIFRRGEFSSADAAVTGDLLVYFALGLSAWAAQTMAVRGFYARRDTLTPMLIATGVVIFAVPVYWYLDEAMGVRGLALATSIGMGFNAVATVLVYRWRAGALPLRPLLTGLGTGLAYAAACAGAAAGATALLARGIALSGMLGHIATILVSGAAYALVLGAIAVLFRPPELEFAMRKLMRRFSR